MLRLGSWPCGSSLSCGAWLPVYFYLNGRFYDVLADYRGNQVVTVHDVDSTSRLLAWTPGLVGVDVYMCLVALLGFTFRLLLLYARYAMYWACRVDSCGRGV